MKSLCGQTLQIMIWFKTLNVNNILQTCWSAMFPVTKVINFPSNVRKLVVPNEDTDGILDSDTWTGVPNLKTRIW